MSKKSLDKAKKAKKDEFYTRYEDVENELKHYPGAFRGKTVYCNCDDHRHSAFAKYFKDNFETLGLKKLIVTGFPIESGDRPEVFIKDAGGERVFELHDDIQSRGFSQRAVP